MSNYCAQCGAPLVPGAKFCASCGQAVQEPGAPARGDEAQVLNLPEAPSDDGSNSGRMSDGLKVSLAVAGLLLLVVLGVLIFLRIDSSDEQSPVAATSGIPQLLTRLDPALKRVDESVRKLDLEASSFANAQRAGAALQGAVLSAKATTATSGSDEQVSASSFAPLLSLARALQRLPEEPLEMTTSQAALLASSVERARVAVLDLKSGFPEASLTAPSLAAGNRILHVGDAAEGERELHSFLERIENLLTQSASGRAEIIDTIAQVNDHCAIDPSEAADRVNSVARNRQSLLDQLSALTVPDDRRARRVADLLQSALQHSIEADRHFADWMDDLFFYYYFPPQGCPGAVPKNNDYDTALDESRQASEAKEELVRVYNPLARQAGLRTTWTATDI